MRVTKETLECDRHELVIIKLCKEIWNVKVQNAFVLENVSEVNSVVLYMYKRNVRGR